jgi:hypothetical protein
MSYLRLFTFITLLVSSTNILFAADASVTAEPLGGALLTAESRASIDTGSLTDEVRSIRSIGSAWTLKSSGGTRYTPPNIAGMNLRQLSDAFKELRAEYVKAVRRMETHQTSVREFINTQLGKLEEISGIVTRPEGGSDRVVLESSIAALVEAYKTLQRREAAVEAAREAAAEESRRLTLENAALRTRADDLARELGDVRLRVAPDPRERLLPKDDEEKKSSCCCCVM